MTSYESLHISKLIKILIPYNFLTLWNFFLQFSTFFKMKQYNLFPVISMPVEKQCSSRLRLSCGVYIIQIEPFLRLTVVFVYIGTLYDYTVVFTLSELELYKIILWCLHCLNWNILGLYCGVYIVKIGTF